MDDATEEVGGMVAGDGELDVVREDVGLPGRGWGIHCAEGVVEDWEGGVEIEIAAEKEAKGVSSFAEEVDRTRTVDRKRTYFHPIARVPVVALL